MPSVHACENGFALQFGATLWQYIFRYFEILSGHLMKTEFERLRFRSRGSLEWGVEVGLATVNITGVVYVCVGGGKRLKGGGRRENGLDSIPNYSLTFFVIKHAPVHTHTCTHTHTHKAHTRVRARAWTYTY